MLHILLQNVQNDFNHMKLFVGTRLFQNKNEFEVKEIKIMAFYFEDIWVCRLVYIHVHSLKTLI